MRGAVSSSAGDRHDEQTSDGQSETPPPGEQRYHHDHYGDPTVAQSFRKPWNGRSRQFGDQRPRSPAAGRGAYSRSTAIIEQGTRVPIVAPDPRDVQDAKGLRSRRAAMRASAVHHRPRRRHPERFARTKPATMAPSHTSGIMLSTSRSPNALIATPITAATLWAARSGDTECASRAYGCRTCCWMAGGGAERSGGTRPLT